MNDLRNTAPALPEERAYFQVMREFCSRCRGKGFIYRGQTKEYEEDNGRVTSSLYRKARKELGEEGSISIISLIDLEEYFVGKAFRYFARTRKSIEVYTLLRHFKAPLLLIDFSYDLNIALFFACNGHPKDPGVVYIRRGVDKPEEDIPEDKSVSREVLPAHLSDSRSRVQSQKSAFIYAPRGYLEVGDDEDGPCFKILIKADLKPLILKYLENYHQISYETAYNDAFGFADSAPVAEWINLRAARVCRDENKVEQGNKFLKKVEDSELMVREREGEENLPTDSKQADQQPEKGSSQPPVQGEIMWDTIFSDSPEQAESSEPSV